MILLNPILRINSNSSIPSIYGTILRYKDFKKLELYENIRRIFNIKYKGTFDAMKTKIFSLIISEYFENNAALKDKNIRKLFKTVFPWFFPYYYYITLIGMLSGKKLDNISKFIKLKEEKSIRDFMKYIHKVANFLYYKMYRLLGSRKIGICSEELRIIKTIIDSSKMFLQEDRVIAILYNRKIEEQFKKYQRWFDDKSYENIIKVIKLLGIQVTKYAYERWREVFINMPISLSNFMGYVREYTFFPCKECVCIPPTVWIKALSNMNKNEILEYSTNDNGTLFTFCIRKILKEMYELYDYVKDRYNKYYKAFFESKELWHKDEIVKLYNMDDTLYMKIHYYGLGIGLFNLLIIKEALNKCDKNLKEEESKIRYLRERIEKELSRVKGRLAEINVWKEDNIETIKNIIDEVLKGNRKVIKAIRDIGIACTYDTMPKILADECLKDK